MDQAVIGAHAQGFNANSSGIALLGTHSSLPPTSEALAALKEFLSWKLVVHEIAPLGKVWVISAGGEACRYPAGRRVKLARISGHRVGGFTSCPGAALESALPKLRRRVAAGGGDSGGSGGVSGSKPR